MSSAQWTILAIFLGLILLCSGLLIASQFLGPVTREQILPVASDGFKTVLGALVGALSAMLTGRRQSGG